MASPGRNREQRTQSQAESEKGWEVDQKVKSSEGLFKNSFKGLG